jgi:Protein of unknown function (DUF3172)
MAFTWRSSSSLLHCGPGSCSSSYSLCSNNHFATCLSRPLRNVKFPVDVDSGKVGLWRAKINLARHQTLRCSLKATKLPLFFISKFRSGRCTVLCRAEQEGSRFENDREATDYMYRGRWQNGSQYQQPNYNYPPPRENYSGPPRPPGGPQNGKGPTGGFFNITTSLVLAAFIIGIGTGVWFATEVNFYPSNVASTELIDRKTPNTEICMANGYASMVFDQRLFVSFNP